MASVVFLLYWQVTHQAAVKSTNTGVPADSACSTRPGAQACQRSVPAPPASLTTVLNMFWPMAPASKALSSSAIVATTRRLRPPSVNAHSTALRATNKASSAPAPSMPLCWPSTQISQTTVANIGNAMARRNVSIQAPGRGSRRATAGIRLATR